LKKKDGAITDENRGDIVDSNYATFFKANKLEVITIFSRKIHDNRVTIDGGRYYKTFERAYYQSIENDQSTENDNKYTGPRLMWHRNGNKYYEVDYVNGKRHGKRVSWYANKQKYMEDTFVNGKEHGKHIVWYDNGQKAVEHECVNGENHGKCTEWYQNGQVRSCCTFENGILHGKYCSWHMNGRLRAKCKYDNGNVNGIYEEWKSNGERITEFENSMQNIKNITMLKELFSGMD
jgi:antitoxin component YwqK of YwqJK toxin-antitoxin module